MRRLLQFARDHIILALGAKFLAGIVNSYWFWSGCLFSAYSYSRERFV